MKQKNPAQVTCFSYSKLYCFFFVLLFGCFIGRNSFAAGWVDVNSGVSISPSTVTVGKNFNVTFSLKEYRGESKSFEYIQLWIQDGSGNDLYDAETWNNVSFSPWQQKNFSATTFLDPAWGRKPGSYRAVVRGKVAGDTPFNFGIVSGSGGVNPRSFSATPIIAQGPMSGPPGTTFTQWGEGFTANSTAILHFKKPDGSEYDPQSLGMDGSGHFETSYTAPADKEPGQYTWWAVDGPTGVSSNQVTYTIEEPAVNPAVAQSPMSGPPGTTFTQWGTGFTPNSTATLHFKKPDGSEYPTQPQVMDSTGHFDIPYPSPTDKEPGQYTWWAVDGPTGISSNQVTYTIEEPAVNPAVAQTPMSGPPGTTFTQWGTGFTPNSTATLHFKKPDGSEYPTQPQVMDSTGHFEIPYPSPTDKEPGQYTWWAVDGPTGISSNQVTYTIEEPAVNPAVAQTPMSGPPGTTFTQWGTGFTPNSTATLHFKKPDGSEYPTQPQVMDSTGHFDIPYPSPTDKEPGQYTWWAVDGPTGVSSNQVTYTIEEPAVNPAVAQSPMSGPPGTTFTQWGTGFTPNSTATLHFKKPDGSEYPTQPQVMDSTGHFDIPYPSPTDKEPGQYTWWAVDGPTGVSSNEVTYTITDSPVYPTIAQLPMSASPGMTLAQWGTNFTPNGVATLHFQKPDGTEFDPAVEPLDADGHFDISYALPSDRIPGTYSWWAIDNTTGAESNHVSYSVIESARTSQIDQSPRHGIVGDTFARWGSGFTPSGNVNIFEFVNSNWEMLKQVQAEADGSFTDEYTVPTNTEVGIHYWRAIDEATSTQSDQFEYTITSVRLHPQIEQDRNSVLPNDVPILHSGEGFTPSSGVTMHIRQPDLSEITLQSSTDQFGNFSMSRSIPADALIGSYQWWVIDDSTLVKSNTLTYSILTTSNNSVLEIHVLSRLDLYRPDFPNSYTIEVSNTGNQDINNATIEITYDDSLTNIISYCIAGNSCSLESGPTNNTIMFNVSIDTGVSSQSIIKLYGQLSEHATSVSVTATVSGGIPTISSNSRCTYTRSFSK